MGKLEWLVCNAFERDCKRGVRFYKIWPFHASFTISHILSLSLSLSLSGVWIQKLWVLIQGGSKAKSNLEKVILSENIILIDQFEF
jgi:hypothetical protein